MPNTLGGIYYPLSTDPPDGATQMQQLAESVETGNAAITSGFVAAANWSVSAFRAQRRGPLVQIFIHVVRTTSALTVVAGSGDIAQVLIGSLPAGYWPLSNAPLSTVTFGRAATGYAGVNGDVFLAAVAGDGTNIATTDPITLGGVYFV